MEYEDADFVSLRQIDRAHDNVVFANDEIPLFVGSRSNEFAMLFVRRHLERIGDPEIVDVESPPRRVAPAADGEAGELDQALPERPDIGFYGRDETLYALDRASDMHRIVLLHAYAGSGKTSTAAEFARWYALTGGVEGPQTTTFQVNFREFI